MQEDAQLDSIITMKIHLEHKFFKAFTANYIFPEGINHTHMMTLMMLYFNPSESMVDLSHKLNIEKGSFTPVARKLLHLGYIKKEQKADDHRMFILSLTHKGRDTAQAFGKSNMEYIKVLVGMLNQKDKEQFFDSVQCINRIMSTFPEID
ncbi:MAG: MarR family winged helix-turn-helix transcriptional regulator [Sphaerochaetaceae bacterium]